MNLFISIITAWLISIAGLSAAFGFDLPKLAPDKGSPYRFGHHYDYDNAGSNWNHERVYRHPGHRHHYSRWYYHYGQEPHSNKKHRPYPYNKYSYYPYKKYGHYPSLGYSRHKALIYSRDKYAPQGYTHRNHIQLRDRIPSHGFNRTRPFHRVRIGR